MERRPDRFEHQLGPTGREKQQFRFTPHGVSRFGMQKELSNSGSSLGKAWFVDGQYRSTSFLELAHQAPDLGRFSTRFASLKGDKQTGHAQADKPAGPETQQRNSVPGPVKATIGVENLGRKIKKSSIATLEQRAHFPLPFP
jgi:hypothetical protein